MDVVGFCIVVLALTVFVAAPLYRNTTDAISERPTDHPGSAETALRELEIDRESGLLTPDAYDQEKAAIERRLSRRDARTD